MQFSKLTNQLEFYKLPVHCLFHSTTYVLNWYEWSNIGKVSVNCFHWKSAVILSQSVKMMMQMDQYVKYRFVYTIYHTMYIFEVAALLLLADKK